MHELSIVSYVLNQVEDIARAEGLTRVNSVTLQYGEVSGIVPEYISDCWNWYVKKSAIAKNAVLLHELIPAVTWCASCDKTYPTLPHGKICPHCGSGETWLKQGNEINLKQIEAY